MANLAISEFAVGNFAARQRRDGDDHRALTPSPRSRARMAMPRRRAAITAPVRTPERRSAHIAPKIFGVAVVLVLWIGWLNRDDNGLTPVVGTGYWLGLAGSGLMLLSLVYPLRKRLPSLRVLGSVAFWFRAHTILGVLGPIVIMWHANFRLGSVNSSVALVTMLVVAMSGVIGRYLHSKIHLALHGRKAEATQVLADADELRGFIGADPSVADRMVARLNAFAQHGTAPRGILAGFFLLPVVAWRGAVVRMQLIAFARHVIAVEGRRRGRSQKVQRQQLAGVTDFVTQHVGAAKKAATFAFYERLFRLWHVFHVPLFVLLMIVAIIHVFASHLF